MPSSFIIPDFMSRCSYSLKVHPHGDTVGALSEEWYRCAFPDFTLTHAKKLKMLMVGKFCAYAYNDANEDHLQRSCDMMHLIVHYGDVTDDLDIQGNEAMADRMMNAFLCPEVYMPQGSTEEPALSKLTRQFWLQCLPDAPVGFQSRFIEDMGFFLEARRIQATHRQNGVIPSTEEYINIRRDSSAFLPFFDFFEYTLQADFPDEVMEHPVVQSLKESTNDFCSWANDVYSYNKEQARGDSYNLVTLLMRHYGLNLQDAVDTVGDMCFVVLGNFETYKRQVPSWGDQIDRDLGRYIHCLESFMIACLEWGYVSGRYFGTEGMNVKKTREVKLSSQRTKK